MLKLFSKFEKIKNLRADDFNWESIPSMAGVYIVVCCGKGKPEFLETGTGGYFKKKNPNVSLDVLKKNWLEFKENEDKILYIGQTRSRAGLRGRIKSYIKLGKGTATAHWGGRLIWQSSNTDDLLEGCK